MGRLTAAFFCYINSSFDYHGTNHLSLKGEKRAKLRCKLEYHSLLSLVISARMHHHFLNADLYLLNTKTPMVGLPWWPIG